MAIPQRAVPSDVGMKICGNVTLRSDASCGKAYDVRKSHHVDRAHLGKSK